MDLWELVSLELDSPGKEIGEYFERELGMEIKRAKYKEEAHKKTEICNIVNQALGESLKRKLVVYGSGHYHHFTYGLCKHADRISKDYAYIHFDNHRDSCKMGKGSLDCGSFVMDILDDTNASAVLFIGRDIPNYNTKDFVPPEKPGFGIRNPKKGNLKRRLEKLPEEVYLSFDLDVMDYSVITTDFNQGTLKPKELMRCISLIKETKNIIGADVLGYAKSNKVKASGKELYARIVNKILIQNSPNPHQPSNLFSF